MKENTNLVIVPSGLADSLNAGGAPGLAIGVAGALAGSGGLAALARNGGKLAAGAPPAAEP